MRQVRSLLRESVGKDIAKRRKGSETFENGGPIDINEKSLSSFPAARYTDSLLEWHVSGCKLRRQHNDRGVSKYSEPGDWLPRRSSIGFHVIQR